MTIKGNIRWKLIQLTILYIQIQYSIQQTIRNLQRKRRQRTIKIMKLVDKWVCNTKNLKKECDCNN